MISAFLCAAERTKLSGSALHNNRVGGGNEPPTSHTTVRTVPYTAVQST